MMFHSQILCPCYLSSVAYTQHFPRITQCRNRLHLLTRLCVTNNVSSLAVALSNSDKLISFPSSPQLASLCIIIASKNPRERERERVTQHVPVEVNTIPRPVILLSISAIESALYFAAIAPQRMPNRVSSFTFILASK